MASYYSANDSRTRTRRPEDFTRSSDNHYLKPTTAGTHVRSASPHHKPSPYSSAYAYPPPLGPDPGRPISTRRSTSRKPASWPPSPLCEDEAVSLAREAGAQGLLHDLSKDEVPQRGSIDQEPVLEDIASPKPSSLTSSRAIPTPPTSEDERAQKARRRTSRLGLRTDSHVPEMTRRTASPYTFKPEKPRSDLSSDRFLSPDTLTPPSTDSPSRRSKYATPSSAPSSPRHEYAPSSPSARKGGDYFSSTLDSAEQHSDSAANRAKNSRISTQDFAAPSGNAQPIRRAHLDARRNTDTSDSFPTRQKLRLDKARRPTPLFASSALSEADDGPSSAASPSTFQSFDDLPLRAHHASFSTSREKPPSTDQASSSAFAAGSAHKRDPSVVSSGSSRAPSVNGSRPPSPRTPGDSPRLPRTDLDWSALLAANAARRRAPVRPASALRQDVAQESPRPVQTAIPVPPRLSTSALPYPEYDGPPSAFMPTEHEHRFNPPSLSSAHASYSSSYDMSSNFPSSPGVASNPPTSVFRPSGVPRPKPISTVLDRRDTGGSDSRKAGPLSSEAKKELTALMKKGIPECDRARAVAGLDDWYTISGAHSLDMCPDCVDGVFERTMFRPFIRRSPPRSLGTKIRCAIGSSPWVRLAWRLTLQQRRTDLVLLKDVAEVDATTDSCPGHVAALRTWYGLRDPDGLFVRDFHLCYRDVRIIERLLPSLAGIFVRLPNRVSLEQHSCSMHSEGNRFSAYLDALVVAHDKANASRKGADPMPLIELVERKTRLRECSRDNMLLGGLWHFSPDVPALTVCEDCFDGVVEPEIRRKSPLALSFQRTLQPVYGEGMGSSCQLYSPYMRKVFQRAVRDDDFRYLARRANERREAELRLQGRYKEVVRRARRLSKEGSGNEEDERRLNRELERITEEWQTKWE